MVKYKYMKRSNIMNNQFDIEKCGEILQVKKGASEKEIKKAYAKLVR